MIEEVRVRLYAEREGFHAPEKENEEDDDNVSLVSEEIQDYQVKLEHSLADNEEDSREEEEDFSSLSSISFYN